jgi:rhodanese-related sulfurtransferase
MSFLIDNLPVVLVTLLSGGWLLWPALRRRSGGPGVGTLEATRLINRGNLQVVDVRSPAEFAGGSLPAARNLPLADIAQAAKDLDAARPVLVVCEVGRRAGIASVKLRSAGLTEVYVLEGGLAAWRAAGLPVARPGA